MPTAAKTANRMVAWLDSAEPDVGRVGGKAASLIRLGRLGFRVPPGFCLTTDAFSAQLAALADEGWRSDDSTSPPDGPRWRALSDAMAAGPLHSTVRDALETSLARLAAVSPHEAGTDRLYAVRSSGVAEDGASASFAGLHDTELGVSRDAVEGAVLRCWASLWSDRALDYRRRRDLELDGGSMAVVVQALVPADAAAVVFTRHPVTGSSDVLLINAVRGLGEAMVSGTVTPHSIVVEKATGSVVESDRGDAEAGEPLDGVVVADLAALCQAVELAFGAPMDIEAAHASGTWYLLQARPITTGVRA